MTFTTASNETYYYNPYHFNSDDYSPEELVQILRDIATGVCKPEVLTIHESAESTEESIHFRASMVRRFKWLNNRKG